jgi:hypothetical protein
MHVARQQYAYGDADAEVHGCVEEQVEDADV